jgi:hypothetical protein
VDQRRSLISKVLPKPLVLDIWIRSRFIGLHARVRADATRAQKRKKMRCSGFLFGFMLRAASLAILGHGDRDKPLRSRATAFAKSTFHVFRDEYLCHTDMAVCGSAGCIDIAVQVLWGILDENRQREQSTALTE